MPRLFLSKPRRASATAVAARTLPPIATTVVAIPPAVLDEDPKFWPSSGCRGRGSGETGKRDESGKSGLYEKIGHCVSPEWARSWRR
jgi:hypothetical protein